MSERQPVAYARTGGRPPVDHEHLRIGADGSWRLWRTMGGSRVGAFAGRLSADRRRRLAAALGEIREGGRSPARRHPDGAAEAFHAGDEVLHVPSGSAVSGEWRRLAHLLRRWSGALREEPEAALELRPGDGRLAAVLVRLGAGELRVHPETLHVELYARDPDGIIVDRVATGEGRMPASPRGEGVVTRDGWQLPLEVPRAVETPPGGSVEAWVYLDVAGPYGTVRARLIGSRSAGS
jgi:hypothetical protein